MAQNISIKHKGFYRLLSLARSLKVKGLSKSTRSLVMVSHRYGYSSGRLDIINELLEGNNESITATPSSN